MRNNRSMPAATVIPVLVYADVRAAATWLCRAFGFRERLRIGDHRAQLLAGDGAIVIAAGAHTGNGHSLMVRVSDVDTHCLQAQQAGATILAAPTTFPYGERQYSARDPGGHVWTFSQTLEDVDPAQWGGELLDGSRNA